jgi:5-methylcytosine-specific restriction endonuclease McrA
MVSKRTRAASIDRLVKVRVWERDQRCIICGNRYAEPNAHYISRNRGGLGIEQNIVTLCLRCHHRLDQTVERKMLLAFVKTYLKSQYKDWDEESLYYKK